MNITIKLLAGILLIPVVLTGCNVGMSPAGPSEDQIRKEVAAMSPEKQIKLIKGSPMSPAEKMQKIAEIEKKYGIKADATSNSSGPPVPGAPGAGQ